MSESKTVEQIANDIKAKMTTDNKPVELPRIRVTITFKDGGQNRIIMSNSFPSMDANLGLTLIRHIPKNDVETGITFIQTSLIKCIDAIVE